MVASAAADAESLVGKRWDGGCSLERAAALRTVALPIAEHRDALAAALTKIDAIRNSIVGMQAVHWSRHIYPLVAALKEAGYGGEGYDVARPKAEAEHAALRAVFDERDALAAEVERRGELLAAERERYVLLQGTLDAERRASGERSVAHMEEVARLNAEVARLKAQLASTEESIRAMQAKNDGREGGHGCGCGGY